MTLYDFLFRVERVKNLEDVTSYYRYWTMDEEQNILLIFANENPELFIGNISTDSFESVMKKACENRMVNICYNTGLLKEAKKLSNDGRLPGITEDICSFCDWMCKNN